MAKIGLFTLVILLAQASPANLKNAKLQPLGQLFKVQAEPKLGFHFPFFLYVPKLAKAKETFNILVIPNNSNGSQDDYSLQLQGAQRQALAWGDLAERTSSVLLVPAFPRPNVEPPIYTHSLSRNTIMVTEGELKRVDIQLLKMTDQARALLKKDKKIKTSEKIFLFGFSASAMFANRFSFLHPERVKAVAFGAPGGWPIAPQKEFQGRPLPYPVGIADLEDLTKETIKLDALKKVPMFAFLGAKDENDSVVYRDSYTKENEEFIFAHFGKTPVSRWPMAEKLYKEAGLKARFKVYDGIGHETNSDIREEIIDFFKSNQGD